MIKEIQFYEKIRLIWMAIGAALTVFGISAEWTLLFSGDISATILDLLLSLETFINVVVVGVGAVVMHFQDLRREDAATLLDKIVKEAQEGNTSTIPAVLAAMADTETSPDLDDSYWNPFNRKQKA